MERPASLNNLFSILDYFGTTHNQIATVVFGPDWDVNNKKDEDGVVMRYFVNPSNTVVRKQVQYTMIIEFMDMVLTTTENEDSNQKDVLSDTEQICRDCIATMFYYRDRELNNQTAEYEIDEGNIPLYPFWDSKESNYWGHRIEIRFMIPFRLDYCQVPRES